MPKVPSRGGHRQNRNQTSEVTGGDEAGLCESLSIVACFEMYNCNNFVGRRDRVNSIVVAEQMHWEHAMAENGMMNCSNCVGKCNHANEDVMPEELHEEQVMAEDEMLNSNSVATSGKHRMVCFPGVRFVWQGDMLQIGGIQL